MHLLGHDDRVFPVRRVVHVVRIVDGNSLALLAGYGIDGGKTVALIVQDPQPGHVVRRRNVLRLLADLHSFNDLVSGGIYHRDGVALGIRHVNTRRKILDDRTQRARTVCGIDVIGIQWGGHTRQQLALREKRNCYQESQKGTNNSLGHNFNYNDQAAIR